MTTIAVITGGTAGVGRATAREFAVTGHDVAVLARGRAGPYGDITGAARRDLAVADLDAVQRPRCRSRTSSARSTSG